MGRPPKDPAQRLSVDLRIPLTPSQKKMVNEAVANAGREFAGWGRDLVLKHAQALAKRTKARKRRKSS
jgi:hypothetical protein